MPKFPAHHLATEPVRTTVARELKSLWPFWFGFAVTGTLITKVSLGLTEEDIKNSKFANPNQHH